jgi:hypothetical protein
MPCREWNDAWIAKLYGEIDEVDERAADAHLARCADCRATLDGLERTRATLRRAEAEPAPVPRVVVLPARSRRAPVWHVAAAWAATVLVFASGLFFGSRLPNRTDVTSDATTALPAADVVTRGELSSFEARVAELERGARDATADRGAPSGSLPSDVVTDAELLAEIDRLTRKLRGERARDIDFLLGEITASEWRAGKWIDETREAVSYLALREDGRFSER